MHGPAGRFENPTMRMTKTLAMFLIVPLVSSCGGDERLTLNVELGGRSVSKLPFVIAADQGLYEKYGLDVSLKIPPASDGRGIDATPRRFIRRWWPWQHDIFVDGLTPNIVKQVERVGHPRYVAVASNDCIVRAHIIARSDIHRVEDLRGKRIGISTRRDTTTGYAALELANRMGWDPDFDLSITYYGREVTDLEAGRVDAIIASETRYAQSLSRDVNVLEDTQLWNEAVGGNSILADAAWLEDPLNREKARRLVMATIEGLALFHNDRELALDVMRRWYGIDDPAELEAVYDRGRWMPRAPYPCREGTVNTLAMYDSLAMRQYEPTDFYDESFVRELDDAGFIDAFYP